MATDIDIDPIRRRMYRSTRVIIAPLLNQRGYDSSLNIENDE